MHPATIGPFQILRELGRGGMGEVFLARDTRLDREVAIKALPAHLAQDADRLARFQREAKVLASLNHSGIGAIYGLEEAEGHQYLILELVEGETLADRLMNGAIPVDEALVIAKQIAEALEVAHEKGVIHRDMKPGNVMVTPDGVVKVLDFGLARTADGSPSTTNSPGAPNSPTLPIQSPTMPGAIMGSAGYMSPEQARGKPVDKRSDIFSFGCVLYEMLTGAGPFPGETVTDSLGAILHREPDWSLIPAKTPARVRELLRSCLVKDRRNRLHDIGDARLALEQAIAGHEWTSAAMPAAASGGPLRAVLGIVGALAMIGVGWMLAGRFAPAVPNKPAQTFHVSTAVPLKPTFGSLVGISPDARFLVFIAWPDLDPESDKPGGQLMVRRLDRDETKAIDGTEGVRSAALSPDGRWIAFSCTKDRAASKISLKKTGLVDGQPMGSVVSLCELPPGWQSLCWSSDREIAVATNSPEPTILAVPSEGGEPRVVLREESKKNLEAIGELQTLVDGKFILATRWSLGENAVKAQVEAVDIASGKVSVVLPNASAARYLAEGCLLAIRNQETLVAARFDPGTLRVSGSPVAMLSGGPFNGFAVSANGTMAFVPQPAGVSSRRLAWVDDRGQPQPIAGSARAFESFAVSPDGGRVVSTFVTPTQAELPAELWVYDLGRRTFSALPTQGAPLAGGIWSRDGQRVSYGTISAEEGAIWERRADGSGEAVKLFSIAGARNMLFSQAWSPDGKVQAIASMETGSNNGDVWMLEQAPDSKEWKARPYLDSKANEGGFGFSPDGKWVLFTSESSGRAEVYIQRFTAGGSGADDARSGRVQISNRGGGWVSWWSDDGKEIRYIDADSQIMSVQVQTEPTFSASLPKPLYSIKELKTYGQAFAPDGRLMVVLQGDGEQVTKINLIVNFMDELRAKMAAAK